MSEDPTLTPTLTSVNTNLLSIPNASSLQFPNLSIKLDRTNYYAWRRVILSTLEAFNLDSYVTESSQTKPEAADAMAMQAYLAWRQRDRLILVWLQSTLSERILCYVARASSTLEIWTMLQQLFQSQTRARLQQLKSSLQSLSKGSLSMMEYIEKKRSIVDSLTECEYMVSNDDFLACILQGLDSSYGPFKTAVNMRIEPIDPDELTGLLLREEENIEAEFKSTTPMPVSIPPAANYTTKGHYNQFQSSPHRSRGRGGRHSDRGRGRGRSYSSTNYYNNDQHSSDHSGRDSSQSRGRPVCQICNRIGHLARNCYDRFDNSAYPSQPPKTANLASPSTLVDPNWYIDSGASHHVTTDIHNLTRKSEYGGSDQLALGDGHAGADNPERRC